MGEGRVGRAKARKFVCWGKDILIREGKRKRTGKAKATTQHPQAAWHPPTPSLSYSCAGRQNPHFLFYRGTRSYYGVECPFGQLGSAAWLCPFLTCCPPQRTRWEAERDSAMPRRCANTAAVPQPACGTAPCSVPQHTQPHCEKMGYWVSPLCYVCLMFSLSGFTELQIKNWIAVSSAYRRWSAGRCWQPPGWPPPAITNGSVGAWWLLIVDFPEFVIWLEKMLVYKIFRQQQLFLLWRKSKFLLNAIRSKERRFFMGMTVQILMKAF